MLLKELLKSKGIKQNWLANGRKSLIGPKIIYYWTYRTKSGFKTG